MAATVRGLVALGLLSGLLTFAPKQGSGQSSKVLTPQQRAYQAQRAAWLTRYSRLKAGAIAAYNAEQAHKKASDCPDAMTTAAIVECMGKETSITAANEKKFAANIRAMLNAPAPELSGQLPAAGPSGSVPTAAEQLRAFDQMEADWANWSKTAQHVAFTQGGGGTIAPILELQAQQQLLRSHMHDLHVVYGEMLANR